MSRCAFCSNSSRMLVGLMDDRFICTGCLPHVRVGGQELTRQQIDDLVQLCHPDRHHGSRLEQLATDTMKWLLDLRKLSKRKGK